ncbi:MAG: VOC family protein, partial [Candidatus Bathyarchaeota archaeon]
MDHTMVHFEIPAKNAANLGKFYSKLFDWKIIHSPVEGMDYWIIQTVPTDENGMLQRPGVNGGLYERKPGQEEMNSVNYITVENIDEYVKKVTDLGGKILVPKQEVPTVGFIAVAIDPDGNQFGLLQPAM